MSTDPVKRPVNRKRKKSFLQNARKYAKKGYYGRGSDLDAETYHYFVRIMETYREGFDNDEDKLVFVNNVFEQTEKQEINCSCNQVGCRVVETLMPFAGDAVLKKFMEAFILELRPLCSDRFASHVIEALVTQACTRSLSSSSTPEDVKYYTDFTKKISMFLLNNLEDYIWDTYGNHVIRTCLENLAQIPKEDLKIKQNVLENEKITIPDQYLEIVEEYGRRLIVWPQFQEICQLELTSGFLQILLKCLKKVNIKLLKTYQKKLLKECFAPKIDNIESLPQGFLSKSVVMLLETMLQISTGKMFSKLYRKCFLGKLLKLSVMRSTNFSVQKLLVHCMDKTEFEAIFDELDDHFDEIIQAGHTGIILALAQTCKRLAAKQGNFVQSLMKTLHCFEPEERQNSFVLCMSRLTSFETNKTQSNENLQKDKLNLHGTLILQIMLDFNKPIKIVNSILSMDTNDLTNLFLNSMGSHIADSFVKGLFVGEKSREKLVRKLMGSYQILAAGKYGSRSFEAIWNIANPKAKMQIMGELSTKDGAWSNSEHGKIIAGKVNLVLFKRNKEEWKNSCNKVNKSEKILADILK